MLSYSLSCNTAFTKVHTAVTTPKLTLMPRSQLYAQIEQTGFCFVPSTAMQAWLLSQSPDALSDWEAFSASWEGMPLDQYMADGGRYRRRRYAVFSAAVSSSPIQSSPPIQLEPHQPHYQSLDYNHLNGGVARHFEAIPEHLALGNTLQSVLLFGRQTFSQLMPNKSWHIEVHQFRIEASDQGIGKPTPEGVHRDGVDFVLVMMVKRVNISSGTTTMHDLELNTLDSFTLTAPLDCAIVNDKRCMHGVTPIEPVDSSQLAHRDVLVATFRAL